MPASPPPLATRATFVSRSLPQSLTYTGYADLLALWHLLSLDAPTVAALWVIFIAHAAQVALPWTEPAAMFVAVWILYATDRLLDARSSHRQAEERELEARHFFHHRHRSSFYAVLLLACLLLALLLRNVNRSTLRLDLVLGSLLSAWLLLVHLKPAGPRRSRLPKELVVGLFFPAAVFIPTVARDPALRLALLPDAILFAAVCSLNCLYIFAWEHPCSHHAAHWSTRSAVQHLRPWSLAAILSSCIVAALYVLRAVLWQQSASLALPALACGLSAIGLLLLDHKRRQLSALTLRTAADLCLLTPVLLLAPHLLHH